MRAEEVVVKFIVLNLLLMSSGTFASTAKHTYTCTLEARDDINHPMLSVSGQLNSDRPLELNLQKFTFKLIPTLAQGREQLGLWIGTDNDHSSATIGTPGQKTLYINMVQDQAFAVGSCNLD